MGSGVGAAVAAGVGGWRRPRSEIGDGAAPPEQAARTRTQDGEQAPAAVPGGAGASGRGERREHGNLRSGMGLGGVATNRETPRFDTVEGGA